MVEAHRVSSLGLPDPDTLLDAQKALLPELDCDRTGPLRLKLPKRRLKIDVPWPGPSDCRVVGL